jgi:glycosyltransferase involved in cell wall biosynthesis
MPCLNEAETLASCIGKAQAAFADCGCTGEVIVADNGSEDGSPAVAESQGARVIRVAERGYGKALMAGIDAANGRFVVMGDADDSYDFREIPQFVHKLREGYDLVQGCRLPSGGGRVMPRAMPFLHRWLGNPLLSGLARTMFKLSIRDIYCGMRGFTRVLYDELDQRCTGMEFATEMIIRSSLLGARIAEVPITLRTCAPSAMAGEPCASSFSTVPVGSSCFPAFCFLSWARSATRWPCRVRVCWASSSAPTPSWLPASPF